MLRTMMKSKIHRATVTQADLHYVGSVTVDADLLDAADLLPGELVHIVDVTNGAFVGRTDLGQCRLRDKQRTRREQQRSFGSHHFKPPKDKMPRPAIGTIAGKTGVAAKRGQGIL